MQMTEVCIIGVSGYGRVHYEMLLAQHSAGNVDIAGATIINQGEEAEKCAHLRTLGCRIFDDYDVMLQELAGTVELCLIPTGTPWHMDMTVAALEAGMHVLVEKPAAGCIQDVHSMQQASRAADKLVAVGYQHMYAPSTLEAKRAILDGLIGNVEAIKCRVMWPRGHAYYDRNNWAGRLRVGERWVLDSPFNNAVAHELMMMLFLAGPEERQAATPVSVDAELYRANDIESADSACIRVMTETGIPILFYATHACTDSLDPEILVLGKSGSILSTRDGLVVESEAAPRRTLKSIERSAQQDRMMVSVLDAVHGGSSFYCDLEMAAQQTIVVNAVHEACEIQTVPGLTLRGENGEVRTIIPGIEGVLSKAFEEERSFHDSGVPWARPGGSLDCVGYREFDKDYADG